MNYSTLIQKIKDQQEVIKTNQAELESLRELLKTTFPTLDEAQPGDMLADGCVVIERQLKSIFYNERLLIAAPKDTEVRCKWTPEFTPVFESLKNHNLNPSQWFIPSQEQLALAYKNAEEHFSSAIYWSSTEASSSSACIVRFFNDHQNTRSKAKTFCVRAFRFIEL